MPPKPRSAHDDYSMGRPDGSIDQTSLSAAAVPARPLFPIRSIAARRVSPELARRTAIPQPLFSAAALLHVSSSSPTRVGAWRRSSSVGPLGTRMISEPPDQRVSRSGLIGRARSGFGAFKAASDYSAAAAR